MGRNVPGCRWKSYCWRSTQHIRTKGACLIIGDETQANFNEPKRKVDNRTWALKHAKRSSVATQVLTETKVLQAIFLKNSGPLLHNAVPNGRSVSGSFYKNVVLKKNANKKEKSTSLKSVSSVSICYMTMLQPTNPEMLYSFDVWKGQCRTLPKAQTWSLAIFRNWKIHLSGGRNWSRSELGSAAY